jgi:ribosomal protein L30/L7E
MTDRQLLEKIFLLLVNNPVVIADEASIRDMLARYANPPLSMHYRAALKLTVNDANALNGLLKSINDHLKVQQSLDNMAYAEQYDEG